MPNTNTARPRVVFAGTPDFAVPVLDKLIHSDYCPIAVYTQPDRKAGRGQQITASPIKQHALTHHIPVIQVEHFKHSEAIETLRALAPDFLIVVAYGLLLPQAVLDIPRIAPINIHASLLPRWRGAAPIHRALLAGDAQTGVAIMHMVKALDAGPVYAEAPLPILSNDTSGSLHNKLSLLGADLLLTTLPNIEMGLKAKTQGETAITYAEKITKMEAQIDWRERAAVIERKIRAYHPWPIAYTHLKGKRLRVFQARLCDNPPAAIHIAAPAEIISAKQDNTLIVKTGDGALEILAMQLPGGKVQSTQSLLRAHASWFFGCFDLC